MSEKLSAETTEVDMNAFPLGHVTRGRNNW